MPSNDMTFSALEMPLKNHSVGGIFMIDTMHHIPDSEQFLNEASRVLLKGGKIIMIEPANSFLGRRNATKIETIINITNNKA